MKCYLTEIKAFSESLNILEQWKLLESEYSTVVWMTCDILEIQISDVFVEHIFNMTCDICDYCWEHLHDSTIQKIMLLKHVLSEMTDLKMLNVEKLNKELKENDLSNTVNIEFWKKIITEEKKLAKTCSFDSNETEKITSENWWKRWKS